MPQITEPTLIWFGGAASDEAVRYSHWSAPSREWSSPTMYRHMSTLPALVPPARISVCMKEKHHTQWEVYNMTLASKG